MIYFIQNSLSYHIKIGYTGKEDVRERQDDHQTSNYGCPTKQLEQFIVTHANIGSDNRGREQLN